MKNNVNWTAAHIFFEGDLDNLINTAVKKFADRAAKGGLIKSFFFVRYGEGGMHVRLRVKARKSSLNNQLKQKIQSHFTQFINKSGMNGRLEFAAYQRETERYGGSQAMLTCEEQFNLSSKVVMALFGSNNAHSYDTKLGLALILHLYFVLAASLIQTSFLDLLEYTCQNWLQRAIASTKGINPEEKTIQAFKTSYQNQKAGIIAILKRVLAEKPPDQLSSYLFKNWFSPNKKLLRRIEAERIHLADQNEDISYYLSILESLIHMTNNRLGIRNRDESFIAYALREACIELCLFS